MINKSTAFITIPMEEYERLVVQHLDLQERFMTGQAMVDSAIGHIAAITDFFAPMTKIDVSTIRLAGSGPTIKLVKGVVKFDYK